jgi:starch synthase
VRATGGLADTVAELDPASGSGNGFVFERYEAAELIAAIRRGLSVFANQSAWLQLMANCFAADFSWAAAAGSYMKFYRQLISERGREPR